ncbi:Ig-like domain repeat protein [uncultured Methanobrevibacter sp.]|uniref:Ig-like domain repeat protein n=1 Tax=uncultured Methanobrevibacter sp. TaxID=253161 RepID=UPI002628685F|nr:Ig-like domain repeat protein [uncultured Methanobrevibacter sp.]
MEYKKTIILLALVVFLLSIAGVSASEIDNTIASENANTIESSTDNDIEDNLQTSEENEALASTDYDEAIAQTDTEVLGADSATYSDLAEEIRHSGNITLTHKNYTHDKDAIPITISEANKVIDGNGAVIDMKGSTYLQAFYVSASGVTIKNLTIINANYVGDGGAIYFSSSATSGTVSNCNFTDNTASSRGGAVYFDGTGTVSNCNFTDNTASSGGGAVYFLDQGTVTNCNFTGNTVSGDGGAIWMYSGSVENCNFTGNTVTGDGGAVYFHNTGNVTNCNFVNNSASTHGGAVNFNGMGDVSNCNFTDNSASTHGGAIYFVGQGTVTNCNFSDNSARNGVAVYFLNTGNVSNCNFADNTATYYGGAVHFQSTGNVSNCNFANNSANRGGAVFFTNQGNVTNCNFTNNTASDGGAVYFRTTQGNVINSYFEGNSANRGGAIFCFIGWAVTADSCILKTDLDTTFNTYIIPPTLNVENFTTFYSSGDKLTFDLKTNSSIPVTNGNISISVYFKDNDSWVGNYSCLSGKGWIPELSVGSYYAIFDTEYAGFQPINRTIKVIPNIKYYVNVTPVTTNNKTVNITAKSNIPQDILEGKLLFIVPNSDPINATYAGNGTWWAVYTFDDYAVYEVNATYSGLDNVTVNNATISISKTPTEITIVNETVNLFVEDSINSGASLTPAVGNLTFTSSNTSVAKVEEGNIIAVGEGSAVITVSFAGSEDYAPAKNKTIDVTVSKIPTDISLNIDSLDMSVGDEAVIVASLTPAGAGNVTFTSSDENVVLIDDDEGNIIAYCNGKGQANITVSFEGNDKYAAVNKTISVTVRLNNASVTVDKDTLDLKVDETCAINATKHPDTILLDINYTSSNSSVVCVDKNGIVTAVGEGTAVITLSVGDDEIYAKNSTNVTVSVSKIPAEVTVLNDTLVLAVGDEIAAGATLTPGDAGNLTYSISNSSVVKVEGEMVIALAEGKATITVSFEGDKKYLAAENKTIGVTVHLNDAKVTADDLTLDVYANATISPVTSPEGLEVEYVSGNTSIAEVDANGVVTAYNAGNTTITITTKADGIHAVNSTTINVSVNKIDSAIDVNDTVLDYGETTNVNVTCEGAIGITAKLNGEEIIFSGYSVPIPVLDAGTYNLTVTTIPDENHNAVSKTVNVTVLKQNSTFDVEMPANSTFGEKSTVTVKLPDDATGDVTVKVDGTTADNATVSNGTASITIPTLNAGTHTIEVIYSGDGNYNPASKTANVTVKKATPKLTANAKTFKNTDKNKKYTVTLKDNKGKAIKNAKVTLKVNGKTYTAKTNSKGVATFYLKKLTKTGKFTATITYPGNGNYNKVTKKVKITVKTTWKTIAKGSKNSAMVKKIQKALKKNGYYLTYKGHYLKVDGIFHDCTQRSVKEFQKANGLKVTGKVDYKTAQKLKLVK